jgi:hypothetical protein
MTPKVLPKPDLTTKTIDPQGRTVIDHWKAKVNFSAHRKFSGWERLLIFVGYEVDIEIILFTQVWPGKYAPAVSATVTHLTDKREVVSAAKLRFWNAPKLQKAPEPPPDQAA